MKSYCPKGRQQRGPEHNVIEDIFLSRSLTRRSLIMTSHGAIVIDFAKLSRGRRTYSSPDVSIGCSSNHKRPRLLSFKSFSTCPSNANASSGKASGDVMAALLETGAIEMIPVWGTACRVGRSLQGAHAGQRCAYCMHCCTTDGQKFVGVGGD
jgi:hypothetical protein